jgi:hypothetical protein
MELMQLQFSNWGMDLTTYMGDVYLPYRTLILSALAVIIIKVIKRKKAK